MSRALKRYIREDAFPTPFCAGCGHGILMGAILRAIDETKLDIDRMVFVSGIGCAAWIPSPHFAADTLHTTHGRAVAFATGVKAVRPDLDVIVVSGDGDIAAIGGNHLIHAARRDMDITVICANNNIYGMTGGQVAPTTPLGTVTSTTPEGNAEPPFDLCRLVAGAGARFIARGAVSHVLRLIKTLGKALKHKGFSFVEVLSPCFTGFGRRVGFASPAEMMMHLRKVCIPVKKGTTPYDTPPDGRIFIGEFAGS